MNLKQLLLSFIVVTIVASCGKKDEENGPNLIFKLKFDPNQERLDSKGQVITQLPDSHAAQTPEFNAMSAHYIELTPDAYTLPGKGERVYEGATISNKGTVKINGVELDPIDFSKAKTKDEGEVFFSLPIADIKAGKYPYIRVSVTYQNFDIKLKAAGINNIDATLASFVGYGQYISDLKIKNKTINVNGTKTQGFWAFEEQILGNTESGQAPAGATTVPNPLDSTSAIASGSCLVTGIFEQPLEITGNETEDVTVELSFSINQSFEWYDAADDDIYEPGAGDKVVDMGLRGLKAIVK